MVMGRVTWLAWNLRSGHTPGNHGWVTYEAKKVKEKHVGEINAPFQSV
jgi:hypothetical protein